MPWAELGLAAEHSWGRIGKTCQPFSIIYLTIWIYHLPQSISLSIGLKANAYTKSIVIPAFPKSMPVIILKVASVNLSIRIPSSPIHFAFHRPKSQYIHQVHRDTNISQIHAVYHTQSCQCKPIRRDNSWCQIHVWGWWWGDVHPCRIGHRHYQWQWGWDGMERMMILDFWVAIWVLTCL